MNARTKRKKIAALIPCYNEESGIADVISAFPIQKINAHGYELEIIVVDNASTDKTAEIARSFGATVLYEPKCGKGNAIRRGFFAISDDTDYIVMLDGDATYRPEEILRLVEPLDSGFCNVVIGSRLGGRIRDGSMTTFNRVGNWVYSHLVRYFYRVNVTDVLTGYFAWKHDALVKLRPHLLSQDFAIEMEMVTKMARLGEDIYSVPITYNDRAGESNLRPMYDGIRILWMFTKNLFWAPKQRRATRIALVADAVMPYHNGGKEKRLYEISRRLVREYREIHIYTMKWWKGPENTVMHDGVYFHALSKYHPLYVEGRRSMLQAILFGLATLKLLFVRFDVLDVDHMPFFPLFGARLVTWIRGKTLYATWHEVWGREYWMEYLKGSAGLFGYLVERISFILPDVIISNSIHTTTALRRAGVRKEIQTVPLGVDLAYVHAAAVADDKSDVIFVGRLLSHKNVDLLVRAIGLLTKEYPHIQCKIVGNGPERNRIDRLINRLRLKSNIAVLGEVDDHSELYGLMKASKMLVLPSIREGFGLVAVEAHAAGIPVVTTSHKNNAAKDLIQEGVNGFLAKPTAKDLAAKMSKVLRTRDTLQPSREVAQYDWRFVVQNIEQIFA